MSPAKREILAGGASSLAFVGLFMGVGLGLWPAVGLAAVVYTAVRLLIPKPVDPGTVEVAAGITRAQLDAARTKIIGYAERFEALAPTIAKPSIAQDVADIGRIVRELMIHFDRDPVNLDRAQDFLGLQLPKALRIVERYAWLASQRYLDDPMRQELEESEKTIELIEKAFEVQHGRLLERDVREFTVDRRVFEELLRLDPRVEDVSMRLETERERQ